MHKGFFHRPQGLLWRRSLFQVHLWTGVVLGLYFLVISLSGSVLVFERELTNTAPALGSPPIHASRVSYGRLVELGEAALPGSALQSIDMRSSDRRLVTMTFKRDGGKSVLYFDNLSGRRLTPVASESRQRWMTLLEGLHNELLGGRNGAIANGVGGGLLGLMCLTGIVLWWPGQRVWMRALTVNWRAKWRRINFDLHSAVGFWTLPVILMWALSGAYFIFPDVIQRPLQLFRTPAAAKHSPWEPDGQLLSVDIYLSRAAKLYPKDQFAYLYMDVYRAGGQVAVFLSPHPDKPLTLQEDIVRLEPGTADVLWTESSSQWSFLEKLLMASYSIHFGDFGGTASKVVWALLSMSLSLLTVTGYLMWWNRALRKKLRNIGRRPAVLADTPE